MGASSRLESLRQQLAEDEQAALNSLDNFAGLEGHSEAMNSVSLADSGAGGKKLKKKRERKPSWLRAEAATGPNYERLKSTVRSLGLATVCEEAKCPNIGECWVGVMMVWQLRQ